MKPVSFKTYIDKLSHLNMFYLEIPAKVVETVGGIGVKRLLCEVNKSLKFQCGLVALGEGRAYISINSKRMKELGVDCGDQVNLILSEDTSEYGVDVPEELTELFKQDPEGKRRFDGLSPAKQRYILNYIATVKSPQLRVDKAFMLISNLKTLPIGKESFREMLGK